MTPCFLVALLPNSVEAYWLNPPRTYSICGAVGCSIQEEFGLGYCRRFCGMSQIVTLRSPSRSCFDSWADHEDFR